MKALHFIIFLAWIIISTHTFKVLTEAKHRSLVLIFLVSLISPILYLVIEAIVCIVCIIDFVKVKINKNKKKESLQ